ncbi:hypothetical protein F2Q70_00019897 [Brassica cretica]|uniref:Uncharacterized protein n=1 Tax=Brassica cretica TaxID=69181 RepID=A0A8S9GL35_BRACR|nr:hypothetical protein F2Q70_00019897 [Brassica cretica]
MCEFGGPVRLSPVAAAPRLTVAAAPRLTVAAAPRLTVAAAPRLTVAVVPRLTIAPTPLSSREKSGSAQHELGPNIYVGLSALHIRHAPSSLLRPPFALVLKTLSDTGLEAPLSSLFSDAGSSLTRRRRHCSSSHVILFNAPFSVALFLVFLVQILSPPVLLSSPMELNRVYESTCSSFIYPRHSRYSDALKTSCNRKESLLLKTLKVKSLNDIAFSFRVTVDATPRPTVTAESSQSMCEFRGPVRLSPVAAAPRLTVAAAPRLTVAAAPRLTVAAAPRLTVAAAPHLTVAVAPRLTVALTPLSSREKSGSAQHELGPNRYVGLSVAAHLPCSVESPQASGEHNLLSVGAPF